MYSSKPTSATMTVLVNDEADDDRQEVLKEIEEERPECRAMYSALMDLVDEADKEIALTLPAFKKFDWTTAHLVCAHRAHPCEREAHLSKLNREPRHFHPAMAGHGDQSAGRRTESFEGETNEAE